MKIVFVIVALWQFTAKAEAFEQAESLSGMIKSLVEEERSRREPQKPTEEMSDSEVVVQAALKEVDKVTDIGIGASAGMESFAKKTIRSVAKHIRNRESAKAIRKSSPQSNLVPIRDEAVCREKWKGETNVCVLPMAGLVCKNSMLRTDAVDEIQSECGSRIVTMALLVLSVAMCLYGVAYVRVRARVMIVYASWCDFVMSSAWVFLVLVGYGCEYAAASEKGSLMVVAMVLKTVGVLSAFWMVGGAFQNKRAIDVLLAIPARVLVSILALFAWIKLKEALDGLRDHRKGLMDGVLLPFGIALFVFNSLVKPMIGDKR